MSDYVNFFNLDLVVEDISSKNALQKLMEYVDSDHPDKRHVAVLNFAEALTLVEADDVECEKAVHTLFHFAEDTEVSVRRIMLQQLAEIIYRWQDRSNCGRYVSDYFLPTLMKSAADVDGEVRRSSHTNLLVLVKMQKLTQEELEQLLVLTVEMAGQDHTDDLRMDTVSLLSSLAMLVDMTTVNSCLLPVFLNLCSEMSFGIRKACAMNFGKMCANIDVQNLQMHLLPKFSSLCEDSVWGVRKSCAESFIEVAGHCPFNVRQNLLMRLLLGLLRDISRWVRAAAYQSLGPFIATFALGDAVDVLGDKSQNRRDSASHGATSETDILPKNVTDGPSPELNDVMSDVIMSECHRDDSGGNNLDTAAEIQDVNKTEIRGAESEDNDAKLSIDDAIITSLAENTDVAPASYSLTCEEVVLSEVGKGTAADVEVETLSGSVVEDTDGLSGGGASQTDMVSPLEELDHDKTQVSEMDNRLTTDDDALQETSPEHDNEITDNKEEDVTPVTDVVDEHRTVTDKKMLSVSGGLSDESDVFTTTDGENHLGGIDCQPSNSEIETVKDEESDRLHEKDSTVVCNTTKTEEIDEQTSNESDKQTSETATDRTQIVESISDDVFDMDFDSCKSQDNNNEATIADDLETNDDQNDRQIRTAVMSLVAEPGEEMTRNIGSLRIHVTKELNIIDGVVQPAENLVKINITHQSIVTLQQESTDTEIPKTEDVIQRANVVHVPSESPSTPGRRPLLKRGLATTRYGYQTTPHMLPYVDDEEMESTASSGKELSSVELNNKQLAANQNVVPCELLEQYLNMAEPSRAQTVDADILRHCAFSFPAVAHTLGQRNWACLRQLYQFLASNMQWQVRRTLAVSIHEMATVLGHDIVTAELLPVFDELIKDLDEVRSGIIKHLSHFLQLLPEDVRLCYLPKLEGFLVMETNTRWRYRQEFAQQLMSLVVLYSARDVRLYILPIAFTLASDKVFEVRRAAVDLMSSIVKSFLEKDKIIFDEVFAEIKKRLLESPIWRQRQLFVFLSQGVLESEAIIIEDFLRLFLPDLLALHRDPVANVRITLGRFLSYAIASHSDFVRSGEQFPQNELMDALHALRKDKDVDVRYFVNPVTCQLLSIV